MENANLKTIKVDKLTIYHVIKLIWNNKWFTCKSWSSALAVSPAAMACWTTVETICRIVVAGVVVENKLSWPSDEQMNLVQGDLGSFSIMGQSIGVSGVGQLSVLYKGQLRRVE